MIEPNDRKRAASQARRYCGGKLTRLEFHNEFVDTSDVDIDELVYLIDHESPESGFFARSASSRAKERVEIEALIRKLESAEASLA